MKHSFLLACGLGLVAFAGCNNSGSETSNSGSSPANSAGPSTSSTGAPSGSGKSYTIAVIPKGTTHAYWRSVKAGADKAAAELPGVTVNFKGPVQESDRASQIQLVQQYVSDGTSAIVLAPLDDVALVAPVKAAAAKKIPVVIFDSALNAKVGTDFTAFVSTDNYKGGQLAGEQMVKLLNGKGKVVLLRYQAGSASTDAREKGFADAIKKAPGITVISDNQYSGATAGEAKNIALNMSDKLQAADGIFSPNESSTQGMLLAMRQLGLAGKKIFVGFDTSDPLIQALKAKEINALIAQNPTKMGYDGVKTAYAALTGGKFEQNEDTGVKVVTLENVDTPDVQAVIAAPK